MTQDTETKRSAPRRKKQGVPPGIGLMVAIAVISGAICWFWLATGRANPAGAAAPNVSDLTEVKEGDVADALTTTSWSTADRAKFREAKEGSCQRPLAWVSLASAPGEPSGHVRLVSGSYYSPVFDVSATPVRVALPFPTPYETGQGTLTAIDVGGSSTISLLPAWRVSAQDGKTTRAVTWHPMKNCSLPNG